MSIGLQKAARICAIHAACRAAGLDDDARHDIQRQITGKDSLSAMSFAEVSAVLDHLNGRRRGYAGRRRVTPAADRAPLLAKIDALLADLHRVTGEVHTIKYADAIAKRNGWAECVDFADAAALKNIVSALSRTLQYRIKGRK